MLLRVVVAIGVLSIVIRPAGSQSPPADLVLLNGTIITVDPRDTIAEAMAVREGRIVFVGSTAAARKYVTATTRVIDLNGRTANARVDLHARAFF